MHRTEMLKLNNKSYEQISLSMQASKTLQIAVLQYSVMFIVCIVNYVSVY